MPSLNHAASHYSSLLVLWVTSNTSLGFQHNRMGHRKSVHFVRVNSLIPNVYFYRTVQMKIVELRPGMRRVDIAAKVTEISEPRDVTTRTGEQMKVATVVVNDESGNVKLTLWNEQIGQVKVDNTVKIENGYVTSFRGEIQLNVGRYGKLTVE